MNELTMLQQLNERINKHVGDYKLKMFDVSGGITNGGKDGDAFALNSVKFVRPYDIQYVKRIGIPMSLVDTFIKNEEKLGIFLDEISNSFILETGCKNFTFDSPGFDNEYCRLFEEKHGVEIRVYGLGV